MEDPITLSIKLESLKDLGKEIKNHMKDDLEKVEYRVTVEKPMNQEFLEKLSESIIGKRMAGLECKPEYDDDIPIVDFSKVKFPELRTLNFMHQGIKAIHFTQENTPSLGYFNIEQPTDHSVEYFLLDLPELDSIDLQFITVMDPSGFGKSLSKCPQLESVHFYKVWGLGAPKSKPHTLILPNCEHLDFHRSESLNFMTIWAPKLRILNLQACYMIQEVNILDKKPKGYSGPEYEVSGKPTKYKVNCLNTGRPDGNLVHHARCKLVFPAETDIEDHFNIDPFDWDRVCIEDDDSDDDESDCEKTDNGGWETYDEDEAKSDWEVYDPNADDDGWETDDDGEE